MKSSLVLLALLIGASYSMPAHAQSESMDFIQECMNAKSPNFPASAYNECEADYQKQQAVIAVDFKQTIFLGSGVFNSQTQQGLALMCTTLSCDELSFVFYKAGQSTGMMIGDRMKAPQSQNPAAKAKAFQLLVEYYLHLHHLSSSIERGTSLFAGVGDHFVGDQLTYAKGWNWSSKPFEIDRGRFGELLQRIRGGRPICTGITCKLSLNAFNVRFYKKFQRAFLDLYLNGVTFYTQSFSAPIPADRKLDIYIEDHQFGMWHK